MQPLRRTSDTAAAVTATTAVPAVPAAAAAAAAPVVPTAVDAVFPGDLAQGVVRAGTTVPVHPSTFRHKTLGLYFSASWCRPCHAFTDTLKRFYSERKGKGVDDLEVVLISQDQHAAAYASYAATMPWLALNLEDVDTFQQTGCKPPEAIPTLLLLHPTDPRRLDPNGRGRIEAMVAAGDFAGAFW